MIDFWDINAKALIAFSLSMIALLLAYIAFILSERSRPKSRRS